MQFLVEYQPCIVLGKQHIHHQVVSRRQFVGTFEMLPSDLRLAAIFRWQLRGQNAHVQVGIAMIVGLVELNNTVHECGNLG